MEMFFSGCPVFLSVCSFTPSDYGIGSIVHVVTPEINTINKTACPRKPLSEGGISLLTSLMA